MILAKDVIEFKGMPLFERARMKTPIKMPNQFRDLACFFYIVEGKYQAIESHGTYKLGSKEALIKKCGNYITHFLSGEEQSECEAVAIYLYPELLHELYKDEVPSFLKEAPSVIPPKHLIANELIDKYMLNLFIYFENPSMIDEDLAKLKLKELVMILLRSAQFETVQKFLSDIFSPGRLAFTSIIENNLFSNISIEELAFICHMSLSSFKRKFKKVFQDTPARYIKNRRLEHAAKLLLSTEDWISGIAYECGFQDPSTFSASFQEKFGLSPRQYRMTKTSIKLTQ